MRRACGIVAVVLVVLLLVTACAPQAQQGAVVGAGILAVDPRAPGWTIRLFEANF